jgi:hypothetical protein
VKVLAGVVEAQERGFMMYDYGGGNVTMGD